MATGLFLHPFVGIDEEKRAALRDAGYSVVVFDKYTESWDSQFQEYAWLFGEEG